MCVHVCMCMCVCAHMCMCVHTNTNEITHVCVCVCERKRERQTDPVQKQAGVQELLGLPLANTSKPVQIRCESNPACLLSRVSIQVYCSHFATNLYIIMTMHYHEPECRARVFGCLFACLCSQDSLYGQDLVLYKYFNYYYSL